MTNDDKVNYTITKSKSHFGLFKKTMNHAFKHVKEHPEVFGMDDFLNEPTKPLASKTLSKQVSKKVQPQETVHPVTFQ